MADEKKYLSKIVKGSDTLWLKDAEARQEIEDIKASVTAAMHYIGVSSSEIVDGASAGPWTIGGKTYIASGTPAEGQVLLKAGDVAVYAPSGKTETEYVWSGTAWQEFGSTGSLKALAFKDSASATYTPAGTNQASAVTFTGQTDGDFVTGFDTNPVLPSFTEGSFTPASLGAGFYSAGTAPSFTEGSFTPASLGTGFYSAGTAPSLGDATTGTFVTGYNNDGVAPSLGNATTGTFVTGFDTAPVLPSLGNATTGSFATEGETSSYDEDEETLTFSAASTSSAVTAQGTFSAGTAPTLATGSAVTAQGTFSAGSAATLATASAVTAQGTFSAGTVTTIDVTKFNGGSKAADTWSAGTMASIDVTKFNGGSKAADTWSAGTAPTLSTGKAITAVGTGEAAAQTFSGTQATITVS